jgi:hypothetical protein
MTVLNSILVLILVGVLCFQCYRIGKTVGRIEQLDEDGKLIDKAMNNIMKSLSGGMTTKKEGK